ncbi:mandelate racemase [Alcaligenes faecalis]|uniref:enolase C-terminal domain-like protein n=1 Tax=Alcaligenes faecalis TaxID=511 RepID=UPI0018D1C3BA|nr:enolase C-terminal domain-like protein [Alcaligenes faecalis]MBH0310415.1 mandelate racemase [Alcaligenes faecalis]
MVRIVEFAERTISLSSGMRNADICFDEMTATALVLVSDVVRNGKNVVGLAFDSIGRYAHGGLIKERFGPRLLAAEPSSYADQSGPGIDPVRAWNVLMRNEKLGGHGERAGAVGLMDAALWDLQAKLLDEPLWKLLSRRYPGARDPNRVTVYASGGHYRPGQTHESIADEIRTYQDKGYRRFKIKAGGASIASDCARVESALSAAGEGRALAVDFNAGLCEESASECIGALADYHLAWVEEPVDPLDYRLLAQLRAMHDMPMATGENLFSLVDTRNLLRYGGLKAECDFINVDISLSYGIHEYTGILDMAGAEGWGRRAFVPHAGHLFAQQVAAGLGLGGHETAPADLLLGGFSSGTTLVDGVAHLGDEPGVGFERHPGLGPIFAQMLG